ncbi:MAG TPA: hypothetical protein VFN46_02840 [Acetobacteraceae bacterium]|nr:hypothetical protein [Acetobacteraceae bacterium]
MTPQTAPHRPRWPTVLEIRRYILVPGLAGVLAGQVGVAALLALDVGALRTMILASAQGWVAIVLLCAGFAITFGSAAIGAAVMAIGDE